MNPPTESGLKRSQKYRLIEWNWTELALKKERKKFIYPC